MELQDKIINFLGDSITEGIGASREENIYLNVIKRNCNLRKANNYGISGTRYARQSEPTVDYPSFDKYFASRVEDMEENADAVIVFGGTNDYGHGDAKMGYFLDETDDTFYGACNTLFRKLISRFPGKPIVIVTPLHRVNEYCLRGDGFKKYDAYPLIDYVNAIRETAQYYSLPVCDLYANSMMQPNVEIINEKYFADGLHPNDEGHKVIADKIIKFLSNL